MEQKLVDILGFLQPDSGNNWSAGIFLDGNARIMYAFEDATFSIQDFSYYDASSSHVVSERALILGRGQAELGYTEYKSDVKSESAYIQNTGPKTYAELYKYLNDRKLLPDVPDKSNLPPVIVGYAGPNTNKQNIIVNINQRPLFRKIYYAKWPCLKDLESSKLLTYLATVSDHVKSYETSLLQGKVDQANNSEKIFTNDLEFVFDEVNGNTKDGTWNKDKIPSCFLPDPDPALAGPPSQTIYGILNKPPTVDNPNIKLPSQTPKQLDPEKGLTEVDKKDDDLEKQLEKSSADFDKQMSESSKDFDKQMSESKDIFAESTTPSSTPSTTPTEGATVTSTTTVSETVKKSETVSGGGYTVRTSFSSDDPRSKMTQAELDALPNGAGQTEFKVPGKNETTTTVQSLNSSVSSVSDASGTEVVSKLQASTDIKTVPKIETPKVETPKFVKDGLGDKWSPDKFKPETIAGNTKFVDPVTGNIGSTEKIAAVDKLKSSLPEIPKPNLPDLPKNPIPENITNADAALTKLSGGNIDSINPASMVKPPSALAQAATGGLLGGGLGAGIGAIAGGGQGALIGGLSGAAVGGGLAVGGIGGGLVAGAGLGGGIGALAGGGQGALIGGLSGAALGGGLAAGGVGGGLLAGAGLGGGIGAIAGGGQGALIGAAAGGTLGAAAAKLALVKNGMPKPKIPKPPSAPRVKKVKIKAPKKMLPAKTTKGAEDLLNLQKSKLEASKKQLSSQITANVNMDQLNSLGGMA